MGQSPRRLGLHHQAVRFASVIPPPTLLLQPDVSSISINTLHPLPSFSTLCSPAQHASSPEDYKSPPLSSLGPRGPILRTLPSPAGTTLNPIMVSPCFKPPVEPCARAGLPPQQHFCANILLLLKAPCSRDSPL